MGKGNGDIGIGPVNVPVPTIQQVTDLYFKSSDMAEELSRVEDATPTQRALLLLLEGQKFMLSNVLASHAQMQRQQRIVRPQIVTQPGGFRSK